MGWCGHRRRRRGSAFVLAIVALTVLLFLSIALLRTSQATRDFAVRQRAEAVATNLADAGLEHAVQVVEAGGTIPSQMALDLTGMRVPLAGALVTMNITPEQYGWYRVESQCQLDGATRRIDALVNRHPKSKLFDYVYFLNSAIWLGHSSISIHGDTRANGRLDLRSAPYIDGHLYARFEVDDGDDGVQGLAGDPAYWHAFDERLEMPHILSLGYYEDRADEQESSLFVGATPVVQGGQTFFGDLLLVGDVASPITIDGVVVVSGDVILKGKIAGRGLLVASRNIYIAGSLSYVNGAEPATSPSRTYADRLAWVQANGDKDLLCLASRGGIVVGNYLAADWYAGGYLDDEGSEDVGLDGIPDTGDTGENDWVFQQASEDLDGDGVFRTSNYGFPDWSLLNDIATFAMYGVADPAAIVGYGDVATSHPSLVQAVLYADRFIAGRGIDGPSFDGAIITTNDAIVYSGSSLALNYDDRIHSDFIGNPSNMVDRGIFPPSRLCQIAYWHQRHAELR